MADRCKLEKLEMVNAPAIVTEKLTYGGSSIDFDGEKIYSCGPSTGAEGFTGYLKEIAINGTVVRAVGIYRNIYCFHVSRTSDRIYTGNTNTGPNSIQVHKKSDFTEIEPYIVFNIPAGVKIQCGIVEVGDYILAASHMQTTIYKFHKNGGAIVATYSFPFNSTPLRLQLSPGNRILGVTGLHSVFEIDMNCNILQQFSGDFRFALPEVGAAYVVGGKFYICDSLYSGSYTRNRLVVLDEVTKVQEYTGGGITAPHDVVHVGGVSYVTNGKLFTVSAPALGLQNVGYVAPETYSNYTPTAALSTFGSDSNLWGASWGLSDFTAATVAFDADLGAGTLRVDEIALEVFFKLPQGNYDPDGLPDYATSGPYLSSCTGLNGRIVLVGKNGSIKTTDDNGTSWTKRESGTASTLWGVTFGSDRYVAVGENGTILTSPDAVTWIRETSQATGHLLSVTHDRQNRGFVAVGKGDEKIKRSNSGWSTGRKK